MGADAAGLKSSKTRPSTSLERAHTRCAHCGRTMNNFAGGSSRGHDGKPLCHPNVGNRPDCYHLVTNYGHTLPCDRDVCYEDHADPKKYLAKPRTKRTKRGAHA